jgi:hypothetical protein
MAIKRCPYCRAIIDEKDQYCKNCGTQLLFPEDESVEEDIPGDRVVDETEEEPEDKSAPPGEDLKENESDERGVEEAVFIEEEGGDEETESEIILGSLGEAGRATEEEPAESGDEAAPVAESKEIPAPLRTAPTAETQTHPTAAEEPRPAKTDDQTFRTRELDRFIPTAELGKDKFEKFLASFSEEREAAAPPAPPETAGAEAVPPWAERIQKPARDEGAETAPAGPARPVPPSGIGIPESPTQKPLPFGEEGRSMAEFEGREDEREGEREEEPEEVRTEPFAAEAEDRWRGVPVARERTPSRLRTRLKAKVFDLALIAFFWGIALWLAARSMEVPFLRLVGSAALPVGLFYLLLLVSYWALFYFFLGETFGDRLFAVPDE